MVRLRALRETTTDPKSGALTCLQVLECNSKRLLINPLGTTGEGLRDVTWLAWDTYCAVYPVGLRFIREVSGNRALI